MKSMKIHSSLVFRKFQISSPGGRSLVRGPIHRPLQPGKSGEEIGYIQAYTESAKAGGKKRVQFLANETP